MQPPLLSIVSEVFRIQPMSNTVNLDANGVGGVGRDVRTLPPGTITVTPTSRAAANTLGSQPLVANGLAFNRKGDLFIIDRPGERSGKWNSAGMETSKVRPAVTPLSLRTRSA